MKGHVNWSSTLLFAWYLMRAGWCLRRGRNEKAIEFLSRAIEICPEPAELYHFRARAWEKLGESERALADYSQVMHLDPANSLAYYNRAAVLRSQGRLLEAIADYTKSLSLTPDFDLAFLGRAICWSVLNDLDKAMLDLNTALKISPSLAEAFLSRGSVWADKGRLDEALADLNEAIRLNTRWMRSAYHVRAGVRLERGEIDVSIEDYTKALQLDSACADSFIGRSTAYYQKGDFDRALADCHEALRLAPRNVLAYCSLGNMLIDLARYQEGMESFEKGLAVDPTCGLLLESVAWTLATCMAAEVRDGTRSLDLAERLNARTDVSDWEKLTTLAAANAECGNFEAALAYQTAAMDKVPEESRSREEEALKTFRARLPRRVPPGGIYDSRRKNP